VSDRLSSPGSKGSCWPKYRAAGAHFYSTGEASGAGCYRGHGHTLLFREVIIKARFLMVGRVVQLLHLITYTNHVQFDQFNAGDTFTPKFGQLDAALLMVKTLENYPF
jgi:hypothetical protein